MKVRYEDVAQSDALFCMICAIRTVFLTYIDRALIVTRSFYSSSSFLIIIRKVILKLPLIDPSQSRGSISELYHYLSSKKECGSVWRMKTRYEDDRRNAPSTRGIKASL